MLTEQDIYLFREGTHASLFDSSAATCKRRRSRLCGLGAERRQGLGDRRLERLGTRDDALAPRWDGSGIWEGSMRRFSTARPTSTASSRASERFHGRKGRPGRLLVRSPARHRIAGVVARMGVARRGLDGRARGAQRARRADLDLRGALGLVAAQGRQFSRTIASSRTQLARLRRGHGLHARRADAGHRAPVLRLVGLPDHRLFRADRALRHAAGPHVLRRSPAPERASA